MIKRPSVWTAALFAAVQATLIAQMTIPVAAQQPDTGGDRTQVGVGKVIYAQRCARCHGPNMVNSGTVTPDLRTFPDDNTRFVTTVRQGKNGRMPPWSDLSDDDLKNLWAYISSRRNP